MAVTALWTAPPIHDVRPKSAPVAAGPCPVRQVSVREPLIAVGRDHDPIADILSTVAD